ncbi:hypothetical protein TcasGA2_TC001516 [Tribolium castaneum]|uniref:Uncharacterized protein n=1 Tax=Tribolium castaneum TaxID=7070 RepID=D7EI58_TRICA|nr:hypothetical protein TcasGA2_TC001516 [Tribolium castaneum]
MPLFVKFRSECFAYFGELASNIGRTCQAVRECMTFRLLRQKANFSHCAKLGEEKKRIYVYLKQSRMQMSFCLLKDGAITAVQARRNNNPSFAVEKYRKRSNNNDSKFLVACFKKRLVSIQENVHKTLRYVFIRFTSDRVRSECLNLAKFLPRNLHSSIMLY